jgi:hypothetical protein
MNRRNFLAALSAGIAGIALEQAIPLGRVWSFPKNIVTPKHVGFDPALGRDGTVIAFYSSPPLRVGDIIRIASTYRTPFRITRVCEGGFPLVTPLG